MWSALRVQYTTTDMGIKQNKREMCHRPLAAATMVSPSSVIVHTLLLNIRDLPYVYIKSMTTKMEEQK